MYYLVDMYNDKTNFIDGIDSDTCQKILNSSTIISETLLWSSFFVTLLAKKYHYSIMQLPLLHAG